MEGFLGSGEKEEKEGGRGGRGLARQGQASALETHPSERQRLFESEQFCFSAFVKNKSLQANQALIFFTSTLQVSYTFLLFCAKTEVQPHR